MEEGLPSQLGSLDPPMALAPIRYPDYAIGKEEKVDKREKWKIVGVGKICQRNLKRLCSLLDFFAGVHAGHHPVNSNSRRPG